MRTTHCDYCKKEIGSKLDRVLVDIGIIVELPTIDEPEFGSVEIDLCRACTKLIRGDLRGTFLNGIRTAFYRRRL